MSKVWTWSYLAFSIMLRTKSKHMLSLETSSWSFEGSIWTVSIPLFSFQGMLSAYPEDQILSRKSCSWPLWTILRANGGSQHSLSSLGALFTHLHSTPRLPAPNILRLHKRTMAILLQDESFHLNLPQRKIPLSWRRWWYTSNGLFNKWESLWLWLVGHHYL